MSSLKAKFNIKKVVGELEVIDSGIFHTERDSVSIFIDNFELIIKFVEDSSIDKSKVDSEIFNENNKQKLCIKLINFNNPLGTGFLTPTKIVEIGGTQIYFTFFLRKIEKEVELTYSLLCK